MTSKERVLAAINHRVPDKIPADLGTTNCTSIVKSTYIPLKKLLGVEAEDEFLFTPFQIMKCDEKVLRKLEVDTRAVAGNYDAFPVRWLSEDSYVDQFGVQYKMPENGLYFDFWKYPLADYETLEEIKANYQWPDPHLPAATEGLRERAKKLCAENQYAIVGDVVNSGIWEHSWNLRGLETFLVDLMVNQDIAHYILENMVAYKKGLMADYLNAVGDYLDIVFVGDDLSAGNSTLMSPDVFRGIVKPYLKDYYCFIKKRTNAKLMYHSCGAITSLLDDLIEIGVDILNPVQTNASGMEPEGLKQRYGDRVVFWGAIDAFEVMPHGSEEDVRREVEKKIRALGPAGYVVCENHNIQADVPAENVITLYTHAKQVKL